MKFVLPLACASLLAACGREEIRSYRVPKSQSATAGAMPAAPPGAGAAPMAEQSGGAEVVWTLPPGWSKMQSDQPMRVATFQASGAEVIVSAFPGAVGGDLANVNRWRGQMGLEAVTEADLPKMLTTTQAGKTRVSVLAITGSTGQVMLAAIVQPGDDKTWFVKTTTDAAKATAMRPVFESFAQSFRLASGTPVAAVAPPAPVAGVDPHAQAGDAVQVRLAKWTPPAHWKADDQSGGILAAAFNATNADGGARATATTLLGDGGGLLANINRWREQVGLAAVADLSQQPVTALDTGSILVDLANPNGSDRMVAAVVPAGQSTWFFKLRGTSKGVEAEREQFVKFVKAVGLGSGS